MGIFKRYFLYKRLLQVTYVMNGVLLALGILAAVRYFKDGNTNAIELSLVGLGILVFGFLIPWYLIRQFTLRVQEMRRHTEEAVAKWITAWIENYDEEDGGNDIQFWLKMILLTAEIFGARSSHPPAQLLLEFAPIMKSHLEKTQSRKKRNKKNS